MGQALPDDVGFSLSALEEHLETIQSPLPEQADDAEKTESRVEGTQHE